MKFGQLHELLLGGMLRSAVAAINRDIFEKFDLGSFFHANGDTEPVKTSRSLF